MLAASLSPLSRLSAAPFAAEENPKAFSIVVNDLEFMDAPLTLDFKHTPNYPDEAPEYSIQPTMQLLPDMKKRCPIPRPPPSLARALCLPPRR